MRIRKIGIVGAGSMGGGIAALSASAGVPVVLLDIPGQKDRNEIVKGGVQRALKAQPAAFMDPERAKLIEVGNTEDDLRRLAGCDWILEAVPEKPEPKQALYQRLEEIIGPDTVVTTNTSGIPMSILTEGRSEGFRRRFFGTHFFNPPRYMHLLEVIPTPDTDPAALQAVERFCDRILGKGIVRTRDAPGFIANRLGLYATIHACRLMAEHDLTIDDVDVLTGPAMGHPKSATFRTLDFAGIDIGVHAAQGMERATGEDLRFPEWVERLVEAGRNGEKSGAGFYRRVGKEIQTLDWRTGEYQPRQQPEIPGVTDLKDRSLRGRLNALLDAPGKYGDFVRALYARVAHYSLERAPELAFDLPSVDRAMEWGYGWEAGPIRQLDLIGLDRVRGLFSEQGLAEPELLRRAGARFYEDVDGGGQRVVALDGSGRDDVPASPQTVSAASLRRQGRVIEENEAAALLDLGDDVALLEFRSKMGTLGDSVVRMLFAAREWLERGSSIGLVIGHDDTRAFSAGANLVEVLDAARNGRFEQIDGVIHSLQDALMGLRYASAPVVAAPFGLALGGGAEVVLHADRVQAHAELYIGLVETGVGLIPAGGGMKELMFRFTETLDAFDGADAFAGLKRAFSLAAQGKTSTSALDARKLGFLRDVDRITMNRDRLIADAKAQVLALSSDYVAPLPRTVTALGDRALGNLRYAIWAMREAGQITEHEVLIGHELARVLCGGEGSPRPVSEQDILDLEREAFLRLVGTEKTQERIEYTLKTGKPLRN